MTSAAEFNCILCKETFENKDELQIHFRKHGDPKFNESIKIKSRVQSETPLANEKSNDASEMVNCDVCDEIFPTISKAITHKHKVHPEHDAKYFCPWCGKLFTMKHLYNKHLHTNHDGNEEVPESKDSHFQCDSCNVYFFVPAAMIYHNKFFHRQDTDLPVIGHSKKQRLLNQELLPVYYCSFCGEEYINKVNLHKHICDDHDDENQRPTDVLRCPLCEAIFYHLDAYELHLTFHSSEDLYIETNEMNEKVMSEFSLETVAPLMERIEDLNNLPDAEADVNAMGIESFLQMAMDEPNNQLPEKVKSKKHKKHKKSKKSAITLDEFLSMNQDVFGEDLDFQGIEEVPTKVIKSQLKVKKPSVPKTGAKFVSSTDLQKLQKQGIVVKVKSNNKPKLSQIRQVGQPVKVNPQVKNVAVHTKTQAISASNEVLSKLMNQSSNQLKIVKKLAQEKVKNDESSEPTDIIRDNIQDVGIADSEKVVHIMETNGDAKEENENKFTIVHASNSQKCPFNKNEECSSSEENSTIETNQDIETENREVYADITESNKAGAQQTKSSQIQSTNVNQNVTGNSMNDKLKNIGKHITIKPIVQSTSKSHIEEKLDDINVSKVDERDVKKDPNVDLKAEQNNAIQVNKSLDALKSLNSSITIKSLKTTNIPESNKNSTTNINKTEKLLKQVRESSPKQQIKLENSTEITPNRCDDIKEKPIPMKASPLVLKNISKNITIKSMSPKDTKEDFSSDEYDPDNYDDEKVKDNKPRVGLFPDTLLGLVPDTLKTLSPGNKLGLDAKITPNCNSSYTIKRPITNTGEKISNNEACVIDKELKNTNIHSGNNLLKHLKNITAKPIPGSKLLNQEGTTQFSNNATPANAHSNVIKKSIQTKEISEDIEIFNIDDSDDELEQSIYDNLGRDTKQLEPTKPNINSQSALKAIKHISKNITVKSTNNKITVKSEENNSAENNAEFFSDEDEMNDGVGYDSNDDFDDGPTSNINFNASQKDKCKDDTLNNVLKNLGKHITVKSGNASPSPSVKSFDHSSQDFHQNNAAYDSGSDEDYDSGKIKITEITEQDDVDHTSDCDNTGIVTQSPGDSNSGDEQFAKAIEEINTPENFTIKNRLSQHSKPSNEGLLKNISKNVTIKSLSERAGDNENKNCKSDLSENEFISNQSKLCKDLVIKPIRQNRADEEKPKTTNIPNVKRVDGPSSTNSNIPKVAKPGVLNTVNKEVKVQTFQSETVIEEITTTVTKTIRRVNQTVNQQVFNANQISPATPRMMKPKPGPRMASVQPNRLQGVTVRQATPVQVRPRIRQTIPFRPPPAGTVVRPSNQLVPIRPSVTQIRPNPPRLPVKNMPRQPRPVARPLKFSANVVNHTIKKPGNDVNEAGHFSCFKKPKESLIPGNDTDMETGSDFQYASSSQMSKSCSATQIIKGNSVVTSTQVKSESLAQHQQINRLGKVSGLKISKTNEVSRVERTEINASKRSALEAIEKLQKQGLLVKKPRVEEDTDPPNSGDKDYDQFNDNDNDE